MAENVQRKCVGTVLFERLSCQISIMKCLAGRGREGRGERRGKGRGASHRGESWLEGGGKARGKRVGEPRLRTPLFFLFSFFLFIFFFAAPQLRPTNLMVRSYTPFPPPPTPPTSHWLPLIFSLYLLSYLSSFAFLYTHPHPSTLPFLPPVSHRFPPPSLPSSLLVIFSFKSSRPLSLVPFKEKSLSYRSNHVIIDFLHFIRFIPR